MRWVSSVPGKCIHASVSPWSCLVVTFKFLAFCLVLWFFWSQSLGISDVACLFPSFSRCKQKSTVNGGWVKPLLTCRVSGASWFQDVSLGRWVKHWAVLWPTKTDIFVGTHLVSDLYIYILYNYCICNLMCLQVCNLQKLFGMIIPADQYLHIAHYGTL